MGNSIKKRIEILARYQRLELDIARTRRQVDEVGPRLDALAQGLRGYEQAVEDGAARITDLKKRYRESEREVQANLAKIAKSQDKLRLVKTNKEYRSSLKEIEDMEAANSDIEDSMLAMLEEVDAAETALVRAKADCERESREISAEQVVVSADADVFREALARLEEDLKVVSGQVDPGLMNKYLLVREKQADGIGLAGVKKAVCQGCYVNIRPQLFNDMHRWDAIYNCPNCQRIIYWDESGEKEEKVED
ncbi:MAG: hypothetical protein JEZ11_09350 [Desulfobacterales bacterium]|nr:hypothetical protein [Desulfobacterales bacterium]